MLRPETRYVKSGPYNIAYQVVGEGDLDLPWIHGFVSNVELAWEEPQLARFLTRLASFSRLITFDKRGTGMSDRVVQDELPTLEERMEDVEAVLNAAGSERAGAQRNSAIGNGATHPLSAPGSIRGNASGSPVRSAASRSTSRLGSPLAQSRERSWFPVPSRISWPARMWSSRTAARSPSGACRRSGGCSP